MNKKCLFPECSKEGKTRGLCAAHYAMANKIVSDGEVTWEDLEKAGKALKKRENPKEWFLDFKQTNDR